MERDIFIISVYCLVADIMQIIEKNYKFRSRGFPPGLTDSEVITIEICGEFFKIHEDTEIYKYFKRHYQHFFPNLPERTTFVRQAANLWQVKLIIQMMITQCSEQKSDNVQSIDTLPLPVCTYTRGGFRDKRFPIRCRVRSLRGKETGLLRLQTRFENRSLRDDYPFSASLSPRPRYSASRQFN